MKNKKIVFLGLFILNILFANGQAVPSKDEGFPYLVTFGKESKKSFGDDDFVQILFFVVPETQKLPLYIRIFDADCGGKNDEINSDANTKTRFSVYGGKGCHSNKDAQKINPDGNFKSGIELANKVVGIDTKLDNSWLTLGPFNPTSGELVPDLGGYIIKLVVEGISGNDGNLYKFFLSSSAKDNNVIEGGNCFTYEYTLRVPEENNSVCHLYPFVNKNVVKVKINVFDYDNDGDIRIVSRSKKGKVYKSSGDNEWSKIELKVDAEEKNSSIDVQFLKQKKAKNNNIVVNITNQYDEAMPFYTSPIGGVPKYKYKIGVKVE